jgi:hypothetical protein
VTCTQECEMYSLDLKNYDRLVTKRNPKSTELLRQIAEVKLTARLARLHDNQIPLMRTLLFRLDKMDVERSKWKFNPTGVNKAYNTHDAPFNSTPRQRNNKTQQHHFMQRSLTSFPLYGSAPSGGVLGQFGNSGGVSASCDVIDGAATNTGISIYNHRYLSL